MKYEIVELDEFSGRKATIYSVILGNDNVTLLDHFVQENSVGSKDEVNDIMASLRKINSVTGVREKFFKLNEGKPGDGVCVLYDLPDSSLRLYCIRYGNAAIILGGGGPKPPGIRAWQDNAKLKREAGTMIQISKDIMERLKSGEMRWSYDGSKLLGNLNISENEE